MFSMGGVFLSRTPGASLLLCIVVNLAKVSCTGGICQYVIFMLKLILSNLPVQLTDSLPTSPLAGCRHCRIDSVSGDSPV